MTARAAPSSAERLRLPSAAAALRLAGLAAWTALWTAIFGVGRLAGGGMGWTTGCRRRWSRGLLRILGVRVSVVGPLPEPPYLLAANHLGYLDVLVLAAVLPVRFVAKSEVRRWPVWGPLAAWTGTLFLDRARPRDAHRVASAVERALAEGGAVLIFAEGTSSPGDTVLPYRPALFEGAIASGAPVVPAALGYRIPEEPALVRERVCWWGEMEFAPHLLGLAALPPIHGTLALGTPLSRGDDRKVVAVAARDATAALQRTIIQKEGPTC
ncbi:MAG TPA: lysophospholipid acyltransferase family protein [Gemmatimonadales bacterium]|nr:lysophospholipid acyltransferase family protein [Gemmatimonadales bacterium]